MNPVPADDADAAAEYPRRPALWLLGILTAVNLLNYLDRYVVAALVESLKASELAPTDAQLGLLMTGFLVVYTATSPLFGWLGDSKRRPPLVAAGVALWSAATAAGGLARSFSQLFAARAAVGVGEAAYGTIAPAMLADAFPPRLRGRTYALFFAAIPVGSAAGYIVGGWLDATWGWRTALLAAGLPGFAFAIAAAFLPDPPRRGAAPAADLPPFAGLRVLLGNAPFVRVVAGYAAYTFALGAVAFWTPAFLERVRGVPRSEATITFGAIVVVTGFAGTFLGGWLADRLRPRIPSADLAVSAVATLLAVPFVAGAFLLPTRAGWLLSMVTAELLLFVSTGPVNAVIVDVVPPAMRARAVAASIFAIHLLGDVPSPFLVGLVSDRFGLTTALVIFVPAAVALAGWIWWPRGAMRAR